jgi:hypothetical protein
LSVVVVVVVFPLFLFSPCHDFTHDELIYAGPADWNGDVWSWPPLLSMKGAFFFFLFSRGYKQLAVKQHLIPVVLLLALA